MAEFGPSSTENLAILPILLGWIKAVFSFWIKDNSMLGAIKFVFIACISLLIVTVLGVYAFLQYHLAEFEKKQETFTEVQALPRDYDPRPQYPSYEGPHPVNLPRPIEHFTYPIALGEVGPVIPLFSGPMQYPFLCQIEEAGLGQPLVDNQDGVGMPVYQMDEEGTKQENVIGYSKDCLFPSKAWYYYLQEGTEKFLPLEQADNDIVQTLVDGKMVDFIVRIEIGSINRFLYLIAALKGPDGSLETPDISHWNQKLIYQFRGGVGIGFRQGKARTIKMLKRRRKELSRGYAVVFSSGTQTSNHYDAWLFEDTAVRVKKQFEARYAKPIYTVGIGGSGGAVQQYLIGQNKPGFLDGAITLYSYPDMITQSLYALDCEIFEYYFDVIDSFNRKWEKWENRTLLEGTYSGRVEEDKLTKLHNLSRILRGRLPTSVGRSECGQGWRGPVQLTHNPRSVQFMKYFKRKIQKTVHWTHWENFKHFYGVNKDGFAKQTWDNVGVQYGLKSLLNKKITIQEFLQVNAVIGGWKAPNKMGPVRFWRLIGNSSLWKFSIWTDHNMLLSTNKGRTPAPRNEGDLDAIAAVYRSGNVFLGHYDTPTIDLRHYLDEAPNMHHSFASFSTRARMFEAKGNADNQVIWMTEEPHTPLKEVFDYLDDWILNIQTSNNKNVAGNKPLGLKDSCFTGEGELIAEGPNVWDGKWNHKEDGPCIKAYPNYQSSRNLAGSDITGDIFKCHLQAVDLALDHGLYGDIDMAPYHDRLEQIFPKGVCDYGKGDAGRPDDIFTNIDLKSIPSWYRKKL